MPTVFKGLGNEAAGITEKWIDALTSRFDLEEQEFVAATEALSTTVTTIKFLVRDTLPYELGESITAQLHTRIPSLIEAGATEYPVPDDNAQLITLACTLHQWGWWRFHSFRVQVLVATPPALCNNILRHIASKSIPKQRRASICDIFNFPDATYTTLTRSTVAIADANPEPVDGLL